MRVEEISDRVGTYHRWWVGEQTGVKWTGAEAWREIALVLERQAAEVASGHKEALAAARSEGRRDALSEVEEWACVEIRAARGRTSEATSSLEEWGDRLPSCRSEWMTHREVVEDVSRGAGSVAALRELIAEIKRMISARIGVSDG
jgi:hypothetical protein